ncbi:GNAT family N-acetyltransferase [Anaeromicrobium sediminis]|uniref:N-acetyltransferase n=1 Tax=Anaeromicrobium sediminis TaxID=1478221 RepID=A0A267MLX4_9FIRM|nr:GNAT family N-acetyltransferase [Anaeromicrobium sediminis]PAB60427.1 N-acetyltransferase [Anaeromicrobium sediminis]
MNYEIKRMTKDDWEQVSRIYYEGIKTGNATFQSEVPTWEEWDKSHLDSCRFIAKLDNKILGWIALSPTSSRWVYRGVVEVSVYIDLEHRGHGIGYRLLNTVIEESEKEDIWTIQAGILEENYASIMLHEKCGFRMLGLREKIGKSQNGLWRNVVFLERRSKVVGID